MRRRNINVFGVSFLDVMFCGFGSVILLVMIVNSNMIKYREQATREQRAELKNMEKKLQAKLTMLLELKNSSQKIKEKIIKTQGLSALVLQDITQQRQLLGEPNQATDGQRDHLQQLQSDLKILEQRYQAMQTQQRQLSKNTGSRVRTIKGEGDRQYLTGIKMGGKRILIMLDRSASMLDETIVNIILRRNQSGKDKLFAPKWQRVVATVEWLLSQLPPSSKYQIVIFNQQRKHLLPQHTGWMNASDGKSMDEAMAALRKVVPESGTSLYQGLQAINNLQPRPDNVFLITDGLPTQGQSLSSSSRVSGDQRMKYFVDAVRQIPRGIPVNIILFQIEGDPLAASAYWKLALQTQGAFVSPAQDWP